MADPLSTHWSHYDADESARAYLKRALTDANDAEREAHIYLASRCIRAKKPYFAIYERWCRDGGSTPRDELHAAIAICALHLVQDSADGDVALLCRLVTDEYASTSQDVIQLLATHAAFFGQRAMLACVAKMLCKTTRLCDCVGLCHFGVIAPLNADDCVLKTQFEPNVDVHVTASPPWPVLSVSEVCAILTSPPSSSVTTSNFAHLRDPSAVKAIKELVADNGGRRFGFERSATADNHDLFHLYDKFGTLACTIHGCVLRRWPNMARATWALPLSQQKKRLNRGGVRVNLPLYSSTIKTVVAYLNMCAPTSFESQLLGSPPGYIRDGALDCPEYTYYRRWVPGGTFAIDAATEILSSVKSGFSAPDQFQPEHASSTVPDAFAEISPYHPLFDQCVVLDGLLHYARMLKEWRGTAVAFSESRQTQEDRMIALYAYVSSISFVSHPDFTKAFDMPSVHVLDGKLASMKEEDGNLFAAMVDKDVVKIENTVIGSMQRRWATCFATRPGLVLLTADDLVYLQCFLGRNREDALPWRTKLASLLAYVDGYHHWYLERGRMNLTDVRRVLVSAASQMRHVLDDCAQFIKDNPATTDNIIHRMSNEYGTTIWLMSQLLGGDDGDFCVVPLMLKSLLTRSPTDPRYSNEHIGELFSDVSILPVVATSHFANCPINLNFFASIEIAGFVPVFLDRHDSEEVLREFVLTSCSDVLSMPMPPRVLLRFLNVAARTCPTLANTMASFRDLNGNSIMHIVAKRQRADLFYALAKWFEEECGSTNTTAHAMAIADHNDKLETPAHLALTFPILPSDMKDFNAFLMSTIFASGLNHDAITVPTSRGSALHYAALSQSVEVVQWAMSRVTSVSTFNWNARVPLDELFAEHCTLAANSEYSANRLNDVKHALHQSGEPPSSVPSSAMAVDVDDAVEEEDVLWQYESDSDNEDLVDVVQMDEDS